MRLNSGLALALALDACTGDAPPHAAPARVTRAEADSALEDLRARFPRLRRVLRRDRLPDHHPYFTDLRSGADGTLWVERPTRAGATTFDVFRPAGGYCRSVLLPVPVSGPVHIAHGRIAAVTADALGVERVVVAPGRTISAACSSRDGGSRRR